MKDSRIIIFLYKTVIGRLILKMLVNPGLSVAMASVMSSRFSALFVPGFIRKNNIDTSLYIVPERGYKSFNEFFTRKIKEQYISSDTGIFTSPCDALLTISDINENSIFHIKHTEYSVASLLQNEALAKEFTGGSAYIFRLTPAHYHRYKFGVSGSIEMSRKISGVLHSVQPVCHEQTDVFIQNSREYVVVKNDKLGSVVQMEVGALLVGKISNAETKMGQQVAGGQDKGYFEYGGSSIVVLTKTKVDLPKKICDRERVGDEIPVSIGEVLLAD